jgi:glycosyltransferase involved in cell wall biosynthesis
VLALTKYGRRGASSRLRFLQYISHLAERGIAVTPYPLLSNSYVENLFAGQRTNPAQIAAFFIRRINALLAARTYDVLWIEGEIFPRLPATAERLLGTLNIPYVLDLDDAIFHTYDRHPKPAFRKLLGRKIDAVFANAASVVVGNSYLAERAVAAGARRVEVIPTTVDDHAYGDAAERAARRADGSKLVFGWIGSPGTARYLQTIEAELAELCRALPAETRLIGIKADHPPKPYVTNRPWTEETEVAELAACDIGLAPLSDGPWERGKCGLKAIQYMAMGMPALVANVGALPGIVLHGETGFVYGNGEEFTAFARQLAADGDLRRRMGAAGRDRVAEHYSIHNWVETMGDLLVASAKPRNPTA